MKERIDKQTSDPRVRPINVELVRANFDHLNCYDIFKTLHYEIDTYYGAKIRWHNKKMELLDIRNEVISLIKDRIMAFMKWFI
jgi:hypothetical protein